MRFLKKPAGEGTVLLPRAPRYSPTNSQLADQRTPIVAFKLDGRLTSDADY
jgi:hypothetical protein